METLDKLDNEKPFVDDDSYEKENLLTERRIKLYKAAIPINALITISNCNEKLNANESETFTLEEYRKIILDFRMQNKDLILARVNTPDPYRSDILYNYYYIASEVNKVLFKYESSRRLLHRMKVRNPLNNIYIVGAVHYYRIRKEEVDKAIVDCFFRNYILMNNKIEKSGFQPNNIPKNQGDLNTNNISAFSAVFRTVNDSETSLVSEDTTKTQIPWGHKTIKKLLSKKKIQPYEDSYTNQRSPEEILEMFDKGEIPFPEIPEEYINNTDTMPLSTDSTNETIDTDTDKSMNVIKDKKTVNFPLMLNYTAEFFATDDDFLLRNDVRDYFRKNSVDPTEDFLFELDRTENDLFAILETPSSSENEEALSWKRVLSFHISLLLVLTGVVILLGLNPIAVLITLPLAVFVFLSFLCSLVYVLCVRRNSFDSLAVRSVDQM